MLCTKIVLNVRNNFCTQHVLPRFELGICRHDCGLVDAKIRASDKDLLVSMYYISNFFRNLAHSILSIVVINLTKQQKN